MSVRDIPSTIEVAIASAIQAEAASIVDRAIEDAKAKLEGDLRSAVGGIAARVATEFRVERYGTDLVIHVKLGGFAA